MHDTPSLKAQPISAFPRLERGLFERLLWRSIAHILLISGVFSLLMLGVAPAHAQLCPDLSAFYQADDTEPDWDTRARQLQALMPRCLQNSEYFALLGAAQVNSGRLAEALETLERALLLDPNNGAAQIDYARALYLQGQLFSALELNRQILARTDLPADLRPFLSERQQSWQRMTRQSSLQADFLVGYDENLNGAPAPDQITLTLSGDSVILPLGPEFRPVAGPYANLRLAGRYRQLTPDYQHNALLEIRGRVSEDKDSDLLQLDSRYALVKPGRDSSWQLGAGLGHLLFGGSPLYTATEVSGRYVPQASNGCQSYLAGAAQHQLFHNQSALNAIESKGGAGVSCPLVRPGFGRQQWVTEFSLLSNNPLRGGRPGGARRGWQFNLDWQLELSRGVLRSQLNFTELQDSEGYSALLAAGATRWVKRAYVLFQYRQPLHETLPDTELLINLYRQQQSSNLELFQSRDGNMEIGISHRF